MIREIKQSFVCYLESRVIDCVLVALRALLEWASFAGSMESRARFSERNWTSTSHQVWQLQFGHEIVNDSLFRINT